MSEKNYEVDPRVQSRLDELKDTPPRSAQRAAQTRAKFLAQVAAVQPAPKKSIWQIPVRIFAPAMLTLILLIVGSGTVFASQDSLPGHWLYPLKLLSEDVRLSWAATPEQKADLLIQFANIRVKEIASLKAANEPIPASVIERYSKHLKQITELAVSLDDEELSVLMAFLELQLQNQEQILAQAQLDLVPGFEFQLILQAIEQLHAQISLAQIGQVDPEQYRSMIEMQQELQIEPSMLTLTPIEVLPSATPVLESSLDGDAEEIIETPPTLDASEAGTPVLLSTPQPAGGNGGSGSSTVTPNGAGGGRGNGGRP